MNFGYIRKFLNQSSSIYSDDYKNCGHYGNASIIHTLENGCGLQCAITRDDLAKEYSLVFRGSESVQDWIHDLLFRKVITPCLENNGSKVHRGVLKQLLSQNTYIKISSLIEAESKQNPTFQWTITGHSLGGALAVICGFMLAKNYKSTKFRIITFGSPRVGNYTFYNEFHKMTNIECTRVVYGRDVVASVPRWRYKHVGDLLHYNVNKNEFHFYGPVDNPFNCMYFHNPFNHMCANYINAFTNCDMVVDKRTTFKS